MRNLKTEVIVLLSSYFFLIGICSTVQSRPCDIIQKSHCEKCSSIDNCYDPGECQWCCECGPGTYVEEHCKGNDPLSTRCEKCQNQTHTSSWNHQRSCNLSKPLNSCDQIINTVFVLGNATHDNRCACKDGYFGKNSDIGGCKAHLQCPVGFGVARPGNETDDTECEFCGTGLCSNVTSATDKCKPCNGSASPVAFSTTTTSNLATTTISPRSIHVGSVFLGMGIMFVVAVIFFGAWRYWQRQEWIKARKRKAIKKQQKKEERLQKQESKRKLLSKEAGSEMELQPLQPKIVDTERKCDDSDPSEVHGKVETQKEILNAAVPYDNVERYKTQFLDSGYNVVYEPESGNEDCMLRAIAYMLCLTTWPNPPEDSVRRKATELRHNLVQHLTQHESRYRHRVDEQWDEYINGVRTNRLGDEIMVKALSRVVQRRILLIRTNGSFVNERQEDNNEGNNILIGYVTDFRDIYYVTLHQIGTSLDVGNMSAEARVEAPSNNTVDGTAHPEEQPASNPQVPRAFAVIASVQHDGNSTQDSDEEESSQSLITPEPENVTQSLDPAQQRLDEASVSLEEENRSRLSLSLPEPASIGQQSHSPSSMAAQLSHSSQNETEARRQELPSYAQQSPTEEQPLLSSRMESQYPDETGATRQELLSIPQEQLTRQEQQHSSAATESQPDYPSEDESSATEQQLPSSSQEQSTSEEVSNDTNSAQDPVATVVKEPLDERFARQFEDDLNLFKNQRDQRDIKNTKVSPDILHQALESDDYLEAMCSFLVGKIQSQDLKEMLRTLRLLEEVVIGDVAKENHDDQREMRRKLLKEMRNQFGYELNPRIFLEKAFSYRMRKPYDDLCTGFIEHLKQNLPNRPTAT